MDTRMIDVAIGLALVFALSSLLVTALQEIYSSWTKMRGKVLFQAIVSFVGDDKGFAQALLDHPLLVSLAPQPQQDRDLRRPSYIGADSVVSALVGHLVQLQGGGQRPQTPLQLVDALRAPALVNPAGAAAATSLLAGAAPTLPNAQFVRGLSSLVIGVEQDWPAFETRLAAWYDSVAERSTGWFKRKTQAGVFVIGLLTAMVVNINPLLIATHLWKDGPLRAAMVGAAERISTSYAAKAASASGSGDAPSKPQAAPSSVGTGSGPASPSASAAAAAGLEAHYLAFAQALNQVFESRGAPARQAMQPLLDADLAFDRALKAWRQAGAPAGQAGRLRERVQALAASLGTGEAVPELTSRLQALHAAVDAAAGISPATTSPGPAVAPTASVASGAATHSSADPRWVPKCAASAGSNQALNELCVQLDELENLQQAGLPIGWSRKDWPSDVGSWAFWYLAMLSVAGWLLTGLACTLGAPFWFDALSKLIRLRGSGNTAAAQTADASGNAGGTGGAPASTLLARSPVPPATPPSAGTEPAGVMSDALNDAERRLTVAEVQRVQRGLPMPEVEVSGFFDGNTRRAIRAWQEGRGLLPATGELSEAQIRELLAMRAGAHAPAPDGAVSASPAPLADDHLDGCDVPIIDFTDDAKLPAARGGVAGDNGG